jgi:hypothetical protein
MGNLMFRYLRIIFVFVQIDNYRPTLCITLAFIRFETVFAAFSQEGFVPSNYVYVLEKGAENTTSPLQQYEYEYYLLSLFTAMLNY